MKLSVGAWGRCALVLGCLLMAAEVSDSQKKPAASSVEATRFVLVQKARALEARGRPDMALQLWQQVLLSDPNNTEALAGVARDYKQMGRATQAAAALDQLRSVNPNDPNIARIEAMNSTQVDSEMLRQAGELAEQGKAEDAMRIYRQMFGDHPPDGPVALAYYQTLYGTRNGKDNAIAGMRALAQRNPADPEYAIALGTMLTYDPHTRNEGIRILQAHPNDPDAQSALRQALVWNAANPSTAEELRRYLRTHPQDTQVAQQLKEEESKLSRMNSGIARNPEERAAFAALNAHRQDEAEKQFSALLAKEPKNGRVAAGMGFLRMQQQNFGAAISFLEQAEADGYKSRSVESALAGSRFWYTMGEATQAFDHNQLNLAEAKFRDALTMNPHSPEALNGLAGLLVKEQRYAQAAGIYEQLVGEHPADVAGWRGLFLADAGAGQNDKAMAVMGRFPAAVRAELAKDPNYLRTLAGIYQSEGRDAEAQRVLEAALAMPFPASSGNLLLDTKLQYAGILLQARHYDQAVAFYTQVLSLDPTNLPAWEGLVSTHHNMGLDPQAINDVQRMPATTYESALTDPGFLAELGAIYQQANQLEVAQGFLDRAEKLALANGGKPSVDLQLQLAAIDLQRNDPERAYALYRQILASNPEDAKAWQGVIAALHSTNRDSQALQELGQIPVPARRQLDSDIVFVQTEAAIYAATGDLPRALRYTLLVQDHYARFKQQPPADIDVQTAWLLYNTGDDRALYADLMRLGGRSDLTFAQRETVQEIWADWSVRRAQTAFDNGNYRRSIDILDAARLAFPNNITVRKAVAGGYAQLGRGKEALAIFKTIPMQNASSGDFQGAIGAALAANDRPQAELWLHQAMDRFPRDPEILMLAGRFEQARGDNERAAAYYRASLALMPRTTPADRLAHLLVYPEEDTRPHKAITAADLQRLLNPDNEPFPKTTKLPSLPAYGPDPENGPPPVILNQTSPAPQSDPNTAPVLDHPVSDVQPSPAQGQNPVVPPIPNSALQAPVVFATPVPVSSGGTGAAQMGQASVGVQTVPIQANPPHSLASDAYKGLIFSLMGAGRNTEALDELSKIPPDVRNQLESDIEFVQGLASLYLAVGETERAREYLNRVENFYLVHGSDAPAGLEIQHAWLLYNLHDGVALYPALIRLDQRTDLSGAQRADLQNLWASWAVRRASDAMDRGDLVRGVEILQAASLDYPGNIMVRRAVAGAYARMGRAADALAIFKTIPLTDAAPGDYEGAISAAMAAGDMAQAESWLRVALSRYPRNPQVLAMAARFEQARGNNQRAAAFWRAALAAMPPGSPIKPLESALPYSSGSYRTPEPGDSKKLLDPRLDSPATEADQAPLPGWQPQPIQDSAAQSGPSLTQGQGSVVTRPSRNALPLPASAPGDMPPGQESPQPASPGTSQLNSPAQPQPTEQSSTGRLVLKPAIQTTLLRPSMLDSSLRIESRPMDTTAALVLARFANQTDGQLTRGSAARLHALPRAWPAAAPDGVVIPVRPVEATTEGRPRFILAQYTPSPQEATTGAYSAPQQAPSTQPAQPTTASPAPATRVRRRRRKRQQQEAPVTPPVTAGQSAQPVQPPPPQNPPAEIAPPPAQNPPAEGNEGLSDQELEQRDLPPLSGPWVRTQRRAPPISPREQAEQQLESIESGYSGWLGGTTLLNYRTGNPGYDQLAAIEAPFEASTPLGYHGRLTIVAEPVFLDSGQANGNATTTVIETPNPGTAAAPVAIGEPIGTYVPGTIADPGPPPQQNAAGLGGELQLAFPHFAVAAGYTPYGFLVSTFTGRLYWKPGNGPFTFNFVRDAQKDSQLSYSGLRDPQGTTLGSEGAIWGGVVYNSGEVGFSRGDAQSGYYFAAGGQYLTGYNVEKNHRIDGTGGAYWRIFATPEYGTLNIGANFFAMHYANNQNAFTFGMGGYFSPQSYFLGNVPFTWQGHYQTHLHYNIMGALGAQAFQQNETQLWPLVGQKNVETQYGNPMIPALTSVSVNYDLRSQVAYQITPHWFAGGYFETNDTRNYNLTSVGFFVRFLFRQQPSTASGPTGLFPADGLRPFTVP